MNWKQWVRETDDGVFGLIAFAAAMALLYFIRRLLLVRLHKQVAHSPRLPLEIAFELVLKTRFLAGILVGMTAFFQFVTLPPKIENTLNRGLILLFFVQIGIWGSGTIKIWVERTLHARIAKDPSQATSFGLVTVAVKGGFYIILVLVALNNLGINISALMAGLGVGGVAIALAVQSILGDLFASLTIVLDKPFVVGDSIGIDAFSGTVEHIGMKTTRIRSSTGEQIIFANSDLLKSRLKNFQRQNERTITLQISAAYETDRAVMAQIPQLIQQAIQSQSQVRFERCHLATFGASSLNYETVFTVLTSNYLVYMNVQQAILLSIMQIFDRYKIIMPYPTQTLFLDAAHTSAFAQPAPHLPSVSPG